MVYNSQGCKMCEMQVEGKASLGLPVILYQAAAAEIGEEVGLLRSLEVVEPEVRSSQGMRHLACLDRLLVVEVEEVVGG